MKTFYFLSFFLFTTISYTQTPFAKVYYSDNQIVEWEEFLQVPNTKDFFVVGKKTHFARVDSLGFPLFSKDLKDTAHQNYFPEISEVCQYNDSSFLVIGSVLNYLGEDNYGFISNIDKNGTILWTKKLGIVGKNVWMTEISQLNANGFVYSGIGTIANTNVLHFGIFENESFTHHCTTLPTGNNVLQSIERLSDSTFCVILNNALDGSEVLAFHKNGNSLWAKKFETMLLYDATLLSNGNLLSLASFNYGIGRVEISSSGDVLQPKFAPFGNMNALDAKTRLLPTENNKYKAIVTTMQHFGGTFYEFDTTQSFFNEASYYGDIHDIIQTDSSKFALLTFGPLYGIKKSNLLYDHSGIEVFQEGPNQFNCGNINGPIDLIDTNIISENFVPQVLSSIIEEDYTLIAQDVLVAEVNGCVEYYGSVSEDALSFITVFPNPTLESFTIENTSKETMNYSLVSFDGKILLSGELAQGQIGLSLAKFESGYYQLIISNEMKQFEGAKTIVKL